MNPEKKLELILASVQSDRGNRGLARDPADNLFTATAEDFQNACQSLANTHAFRVSIFTGFCIPTTQPPMFETDGPLGTFFLERAFDQLSGYTEIQAEEPVIQAIAHARRLVRRKERTLFDTPLTHTICLERVGMAGDSKRYSMRGLEVSHLHNPRITQLAERSKPGVISIGIGDGGNEIGMGKIPHETVVANIPQGDLIHCRVLTDLLIVAGVSNWAAYALAAGVFVLRNLKPHQDLFDSDQEREILETMVREGPLVDGVSGKQTASVDGLSWDDYSKPLNQIREILDS